MQVMVVEVLVDYYQAQQQFIQVQPMLSQLVQVVQVALLQV